ncbi:hypothetical protein ACFC1R_06265 [Kitasatospora sp. NPDC056138]|uniref:hypothetical protein n=1 Tax=Kitasatospora sp. NPDC056138 TaxID=3345724 RepID=UPI0035DC13C2
MSRSTAPRAGQTELSLAAAALCLAVSWIHVQDQGGFPGDKTPGYMATGYYLLEAAGVLCAALLLTGVARRRQSALTWLLAAAVALGPLLGYLLSRGPGLPGYDDDRGNWTEPLGLISLAVEGVLLVLALVGLRTTARTAAPGRRRRHG